MVRLVPFNKDEYNLLTGGSLDFSNMIDNFFKGNKQLFNDSFKVDVKETENGYEIEAELPGVKKKETEVVISDECLKISVNKSEEKNIEEENYIHRERSSSSMSRSLYLKDMDEKNTKAKLEDGVLKIEVPKKNPESQKTKISII